MKFISIVVALLFSTSAFAFSGSHGSNNAAGGEGGSATAIAIGAANAVSKSSANANSNSRSSSYANQYQGQQQGQIQGQLQANVNKSSGNVQITEMHRKNLRNAPSFGLPAAFPTAVCQGTAAAGFSFWLGGGAVAGTITIEECMKLETIRVGTIMLQNSVTVGAAEAQEQANIQVFCLTKYGSLTGLCGGDGQNAAADVEPVAVSVVEPVKVASIPDETFEPKGEVKRAKIWFFGL